MNRIAKNGGAARISGIGSIAAAAFALALSAGTARAAVVVHDNTAGTFKWTVSIDNLGNEDILGTFLDITKSPSSQTGEMKAGAFGRWFVPRQSSSDAPTTVIAGVTSSEVADTTNRVSMYWNDTVLKLYVTREYLLGEAVDADASWFYRSIYFLHDLSAEIPEKFIGTSAITPRAYLGVRLKVSTDNYRYGWILLDQYKNPMMWAYETELNTPIEIPVPAPAGALAGAIFGTSLAFRRRRRGFTARAGSPTGVSPAPRTPARRASR